MNVLKLPVVIFLSPLCYCAHASRRAPPPPPKKKEKKKKVPKQCLVLTKKSNYFTVRTEILKYDRPDDTEMCKNNYVSRIACRDSDRRNKMIERKYS